MKKKLFLTGIVLAMFILGACAKTETKETTSAPESRTEDQSKDTNNTDTKTEPEKETQDGKTDTEETPATVTEVEEKEPAVKTMSSKEFDKLLLDLPVSVVNTKYTIQDEKYKSLYPDLLQAIIQNNTEEDIKSAVVAFAAWDKNGLPVKIVGYLSFNNGGYISEVNYDDINLAAGGKYGEDSGLQLSEETLNIDSVKAIVKSYETFEGKTWENPYYDEFCDIYEEKKLSKEATVDVKIEDLQTDSGKETAKTDSKDDEDLPSAKELDELLKAEQVFIKTTKYTVQDETYKSLYPDMLQAIVQNDTKDDIKSAVIAFAAWDKNGLPVKIKGSLSFADGSYITKVDYSDINLAAGSSYGEESGYNLEDGLNIKTFKAIVVSYETYDGTSWENPYFKTFCTLYEGKKMKK